MLRGPSTGSASGRSAGFRRPWWGRTPTKELALLRVPVHRHYGNKVLYALVGLLIPPMLTYYFTVLGWPIPC